MIFNQKLMKLKLSNDLWACEESDDNSLNIESMNAAAVHNSSSSNETDSKRRKLKPIVGKTVASQKKLPIGKFNIN